MKHHNSRLRNGAAIVLAVAVFVFPITQPIGRAQAQSRSERRSEASYPLGRIATSQDRARELSVYSLRATADQGGVLLQWNTNFELDNVGFDIYRVRSGQRSQINRSIIPGSMFIVGEDVPLRAGHAYTWFDRGGTGDAVYYVESINLNGTRKLYEKGATVSRGKLPESFQTEATTSQVNQTSGGTSEYPSASAPNVVQSGTLQKQWEIAAQTALKIQIKKDAWYRVTQQQMVAAGFNPVVDIQNLSLYVNAQEIAIRTSKSSGQFGSGDYLEFYGQGVDKRETDSQIYYLIAGTQPGKRVDNSIAANGPGDPLELQRSPEPTSPVDVQPAYRGLFVPLINFRNGAETPSAKSETEGARTVAPSDQKPAGLLASPSVAEPISSSPATITQQADESKTASPVVADATQTQSPSTSDAGSASLRKSEPVAKSRKRKSRKRVNSVRRRYAHAGAAPAATALSFEYTVQVKERFVYFLSLLNGDTENYFGPVITNNPVTETLAIHNAQSGADGPARLEVAVQGANFQSHQVNVFLNTVLLGAISSFGRDHSVQVFNVPVSQLQDGNNAVRLQCATQGDLSLVDYVRLTYPHSYTADGDSLRISLRRAQTAKIDGFTIPSVMLLDITDPTAVSATNAVSEGSGPYTITVPSAPKKKARGPVFGAPELQPLRTIYALPQGQFDQPAGLSLNQPSTLNLNTNQADLLIISHKDFIPSLSKQFLPAGMSFITQRQIRDQLTVKVVDVEDVYDEFSFGSHTAQALKDLLLRATSTWTKAPHYVLFVGDASYDPRNYSAAFIPGGPFDFVPTQLIDTVFGEACSDDVLADFDGDGVPELAVGRLPARTPAEADLMLSKLVNFSKANVTQTAMLVADNRGCDAQGNNCFYFDFAQANMDIGALLPSGLAKQFVNRSACASFVPVPSGCSPSDAATNTTIIDSFNQGVALVNYSGHGNVNVWSNAPLFTNDQARALTNGNKLGFVVVANCLNGLFDDPSLEGIGEALVKAPGGGAVGSWTSSAETVADGQHDMAKRFYQLTYGSQSIALGDAIKQAKAFTTDVDVRRSWILLGDPTMKIW